MYPCQGILALGMLTGEGQLMASICHCCIEQRVCCRPFFMYNQLFLSSGLPCWVWHCGPLTGWPPTYFLLVYLVTLVSMFQHLLTVGEAPNLLFVTMLHHMQMEFCWEWAIRSLDIKTKEESNGWKYFFSSIIPTMYFCMYSWKCKYHRSLWFAKSPTI